MTTLADLARREIAKRDEQRERNRQRMPQIAAWKDTLEAAGMGPVRVIWARENGHEVGKEP